MVYSAAQWSPGGECQQLGGVDCSFEDKMAQPGAMISGDYSLDKDSKQTALSGCPPCVCTTPEPDDEEDVAFHFGDIVPPSPAPSSTAPSTATPTDSLQELDSRPCKLVVQGTFIQAVPDAPQPQPLQHSQTAAAQRSLLRAQTDSVLAMQALQACPFESDDLPEAHFNGSMATPTATLAPPPLAAPDQGAAALWEATSAPTQLAAPDQGAAARQEGVQTPVQNIWAAPAQGGPQPEGVAWAHVQADVDHGVPQELVCPVMLIDAACAAAVQNVMHQIEYYLSDYNLQTDDFFHQKINESLEGWLDIELLMKCNIIRSMGATYEMVQLAACQSVELELREDCQAVRRACGRPLPPQLRAAPALPAETPPPPPPPQGTPLAFCEHDVEWKRKGQELLSLLMASQATQDRPADEVPVADQTQACWRPRLGAAPPLPASLLWLGGLEDSDVRWPHQVDEADGERVRAGLHESTAEPSCSRPLPSEQELKTSGQVTVKALSGCPPCVCATPEPDDEEDVACQFGDSVPPSPAPSSAAPSTATPTDSLQELDSRPCKLVVQGTFIQAVPDAPQPQPLQRSQTAAAQRSLLRAQTDSVLAMQTLQACPFESDDLPEAHFNGSMATPTATPAPPPPAAPDQGAPARWEATSAPTQLAAPDQGAAARQEGVQIPVQDILAAPAQGGPQPEGVAWAHVQADVDHGVPQEFVCPVMLIDAACAAAVQNVLHQIEYYLSDYNLQTDDFFHQKINESLEGWLDIDLFMKCNMIRSMGASYEMIQLAACQSVELELREDCQAVRRACGRPLPPLLPAAPALPAETPPPPPQGTPLAFAEHDAEGKRKGQELLSLLMASQATQDRPADEVPVAGQTQACWRPRLAAAPPRPHRVDEADGEMARAGLHESTAEPSCSGSPPSEKELRTGGLVTVKTLPVLLRCPKRILELCFEDPGCRHIQDALEVGGREEHLNVANAIGGSVRKLLLSPQGNHVVQKLVKVMPAEDTAFVAQEILGEAVKVARSQFGCRGIQRLVDKCLHLPSTQALLEELLRDPQAIRDLCKHPFGHFVAQCVLEYGLEDCALDHSTRASYVVEKDCALDPSTRAKAEELKSRVAGAMRRDLPKLAAHKSASYVVERAITNCDEQDQVDICRALTDPDVVRALASSRGVHVLRAISRKSEELRDAVRRSLSDDWLASEEGRKAQASKHAKMLLKDLGIPCDDPDAAAEADRGEPNAEQGAAREEAA